MSIKHAFTSAKPEGADSSLVRSSDWNADHEDTTSVLYHGAVADGATDTLAAFQACVGAAGVAYVPAGTYYLSALPTFSASSQGVVGDGVGRSVLIVGGAGLRAANGSALLENIRVEGLTIQASTNALTADGQQSWVDATAIDLTGISRAVIRDVYVYRFRTALKLHSTDSSHRSYYNHIENFRSWGGETGIYIGGVASPRDGANANKFIGAEIVAAKVGIVVRGAYNSFVGTKIECPAQTNGYPLTCTGIQFDSGYYAISNTFTDTYCELVGTGNKGIYIYDTGLTNAWVTPNRFNGGAFVVNGAKEAPTFDSRWAAQVYGFHFDATNLVPTRRLAYTPDGTLIQETYPDAGGILQTDASGNTIYSAT